MTALRAEAPRRERGERETRREALREAYMRKTLRQAKKEGFQRIAVICGACLGRYARLELAPFRHVLGEEREEG